jgi:hypothetical protein
MFQEQADELLARVPGSADYRDLGWHFRRHNAQCVLQPESIATKSSGHFDWDASNPEPQGTARSPD